MSVSLYGTPGNQFSFLPSIGGFFSTTPLDLGSYTTTVPLNTHPMLIAAVSYEGTGPGSGAGEFTGAIQLSWGNVNMRMFAFPTTILGAASDTHSTVIGVLPFDASTVFADDHVRMSFTTAPQYFGTKAGLIGIAQNVDPTSIYTGFVSKTVLDTTNPLLMTLPTVAGSSGDMLFGLMVSAYSGIFANPYLTPAGTPNTFVVDTYVPTIYQYPIAYRQLASAESDQVIFSNVALAGSSGGWFSAAWNLQAYRRRRWVWIIE